MEKYYYVVTKKTRGDDVEYTTGKVLIDIYNVDKDGDICDVGLVVTTLCGEDEYEEAASDWVKKNECEEFELIKL